MAKKRKGRGGGKKPTRKQQGSKKSVHEPQEECPPPEAKGTVVVHVVCKSPGPSDNKGIVDIGVKCSTKPDAKTKGPGTAQFTDLDPADYTVSISFEEKYEKFYVLDPAPKPVGPEPDQPKPETATLAAGQTETFRYEVPVVWVQFQVKDVLDKPLAQAAYELTPPKGEATRDELDEDGKVFEELVPKGDHELAVCILFDAKVDKDKIKVAEEVKLEATVSGFENDTAGEFEIRPAHGFGDPVKTVGEAKVKDGKLEATWKPEAKELAGLSRSWVVVAAKIGEQRAWSKPVRILHKPKIEVVDGEGKPHDVKLDLVFAGLAVDATASGGEAEPEVPWGLALSRLGLPDDKGAYAMLELDELSKRPFPVPA